ncbi:sodium channel protein Nach-like [Arctopsyche grandis]|uniref:sodium channel protein Nach-like n=1 Tax=Arctopsyche grandis TaxID=121162 RepID=UPI00406D95DB
MNYSNEEPVVLKFSRRTTTPKKGESTNRSKNNAKTTTTTTKSFWLRHLIEFFRTTGLHGYKYIVTENTPFIERFFWAIAVGICLVTAICLVWIAWGWNSENPTLTVIESTHYQTWNYPYPAVTICSLNKVSRASAQELSQKLIVPPPYTISPEDIFDQMKYVTAILGNTPVTKEQQEHMVVLQAILDHNNITISKLLKKVTPSCKDLMQKCSWKSTIYRCETIFQDVISSEGVCCAFNYYGAFVKQNFVNQSKNPRRVASCGADTALALVIKIDTKNYYSSTFGTYGTRIYIHDSYDFPDDNAAGKLIAPSSEAFIELSPEMTYATDAIKSMPIEKRKCVISKELSTQSFTKYTYTNCLAECRSKIVMDRCGCVPIFLPTLAKSRTCNFLDIQCVYKIRLLYSSSYPETNVSCKCLPTCDRYSYPMEISIGSFRKIALRNSEESPAEKSLVNQTLVNIYFSDLMGTRFRMDIFMTWYNLLASFGGLLGLFVGFSLVSGFELVYFFTVRFFFDMLHKNQPVKDSSNQSGKDLSNSQLFNKWVQKHNILSLNSSNARKPPSRQDDD